MGVPQRQFDGFSLRRGADVSPRLLRANRGLRSDELRRGGLAGADPGADGGLGDFGVPATACSPLSADFQRGRPMARIVPAWAYGCLVRLASDFRNGEVRPAPGSAPDFGRRSRAILRLCVVACDGQEAAHFKRGRGIFKEGADGETSPIRAIAGTGPNGPFKTDFRLTSSPALRPEAIFPCQALFGSFCSSCQSGS